MVSLKPKRIDQASLVRVRFGFRDAPLVSCSVSSLHRPGSADPDPEATFNAGVREPITGADGSRRHPTGQKAVDPPLGSIVRCRSVTKSDEKYHRIEQAKERFRKLSSETIRQRLNTGYINEEGQVAYREVLEERGEWEHPGERSA